MITCQFVSKHLPCHIICYNIENQMYYQESIIKEKEAPTINEVFWDILFIRVAKTICNCASHTDNAEKRILCKFLKRIVEVL